MKTVGITGASGLLGFHMRALLQKRGYEHIVLADRNTLAAESALDAFLEEIDVLIHLAAATRGDENEIYKTNTDLTDSLISGLERGDKKIPLIFSSTVQATKDTAYGMSKRESGERLLSWGAMNNVPVTVLVIPNVFGEFAKPFHNSVVATFCHQLIEGIESNVASNAYIRLMHAQEVAEIIESYIASPVHGQINLEGGTDISVEELYKKLSLYHQNYQINDLPLFNSRFDQHLFNTYQSYLPDATYPRKLNAHSDSRGSLFEIIRAQGGGVVFSSTTKPGAARGNHWHTRKMERFCVIEGTAEMHVRKLFSDEISTYILRGDEPAFVDTKTFYVHDLVNVGASELVTLFWGNELYSEEDSDTYQEKV